MGYGLVEGGSSPGSVWVSIPSVRVTMGGLMVDVTLHEMEAMFCGV